MQLQTDSGVYVCVRTDSSRVKRMCVAERRQPYSGNDWCSGGESDEDDKGFFSKCASKRTVIALPMKSTLEVKKQNKKTLADPKLHTLLFCSPLSDCNSSDVKPQDSVTHSTSNAGLSRSSTPSHNTLGSQGSTVEPPTGQKPGSKLVYVFTTEMANK